MCIIKYWTQKYKFIRKLHKPHRNHILWGILFLRAPDCNINMGGNSLLSSPVLMWPESVHIVVCSINTSAAKRSLLTDRKNDNNNKPWPLLNHDPEEEAPGLPWAALLNNSCICKPAMKKWFPVELEVAPDNLSQWGKITIVTGLNKTAQHGPLAEPGSSCL